MPTIQEFDYSVNLLKAILWQYNSAPNLQAILNAKQTWYNKNQSEFWEDWFTDVFNLETCNDFGCIVWAIILGIPTNLISAPQPNNKTPFGFDTTNLSNFNVYNFTANASSSISFTIDQKRIILRLRYRQLVSRATVPEVNKILKDILGAYGNMHMIDGLNMTQLLICNFPIPSFLNILFSEFDIIPRPGGVKMIVVDTTVPVFGFGSFNQNFFGSGFTPFF